MSQRIPDKYNTDSALLDGIHRGEEKAFADLYDKYAPLLLGVILRIVDEREIAEKILLQTFQRIAEGLKSFDASKERVLIFMLNIARATAWEISPLQTKKQFAEISTHGNYVSSAMLNNKDEFPEQNQQLILDLIYFKKYSLQQVAEELDLSLDAIKSKIKAEFNQLRRLNPNE